LRCGTWRVASAAADHGPVAASGGGAGGGGGGHGWIPERELGTAEQLDSVDGKYFDGSDWREGLAGGLWKNPVIFFFCSFNLFLKCLAIFSSFTSFYLSNTCKLLVVINLQLSNGIRFMPQLRENYVIISPY
jgi:hypothetical protein